MIKIWFRTLTRYKLYTFINIAGLSLGICAVVAIFLYIVDELSYDRYQANVDRIYRINVTNKFDSESRWPTSAAPIADAIRNDLTTTEKVARIYTRQASIEVHSRRCRWGFGSRRPRKDRRQKERLNHPHFILGRGRVMALGRCPLEIAIPTCAHDNV